MEKKLFKKLKIGTEKFLYKDYEDLDKEEKNNNKEENEREKKDKFCFFHFRKNNEAEIEEISVSKIKDLQGRSFEKKLKGEELLRRDLNASPIYVESEGCLLKVTEISIYEKNEDEVTLFVSSAYEDFIMKFPVKYSF